MLLRIDQILYIISTALMVPVLVALGLLLAWTLVQAGGMAREGVARLGRIPASGYISRYTRAAAAGDALAIDRAIDDIEIEMARRVGALSTAARLGPMLGLAGTLIPLGPALVELARGNMGALAGQLVVAFGATIIGLLAGILCVVAAQVRRGWYARDLSEILYLDARRTS